MDTSTKYTILQEPVSDIDLAMDLLREREVLTYPELLNQFPDIDIRKLLHRIDWLFESGHPIRRIEGKGFVYGMYSIEEATQMLRDKFVEDVLAQSEYCETYIRESVFGIEYTLIQNTAWPLGIQNLLIMNNGTDKPVSIEFQERSISYQILIFLLSNPRHVITNYQLAKLVASTGGNIDYYDSLSVYRWFDYLRDTYKIPLIPLQSSGWGMTNIQIQEGDREANLERRLNAEWRKVFDEELLNMTVSTSGRVKDLRFFFPKLNMGYLPRHAYVATRDNHSHIRLFDMQTLHSVKRVFESLVRNGGYIDRYTVAKHSKEQWWLDQLEEEQQRTNYVTGNNAKSKLIDVTSEDGYDYAIKRLKDFLEENDLPKLLPHSSESGYVLDTVPKGRRDFIKQRMLAALEIVLGKRLNCNGHPEEYSLESFEIYDQYNLKIIIFDLDKIEEVSGSEMFQPSIYKTHGAVFVRHFYDQHEIKTLVAAIELNTSQANLLKQFRNSSVLDTSDLPKRERDNIQKFLSGIEVELGRSGFELEEGTGKIVNKVVTIPVPVMKEG